MQLPLLRDRLPLLLSSAQIPRWQAVTAACPEEVQAPWHVCRSYQHAASDSPSVLGAVKYPAPQLLQRMMICGHGLHRHRLLWVLTALLVRDENKNLVTSHRWSHCSCQALDSSGQFTLRRRD